MASQDLSTKEAEPPVKGLAWFKDDTGEYIWNQEKDKYEHYAFSDDGSGATYFKDYYDASNFIPFSKGSYGFKFVSKFNAAEYSVLTKGTIFNNLINRMVKSDNIFHKEIVCS